MRKHFTKGKIIVMLTICLASLTQTTTAQITLVESPGTGSQDISRVSKVGNKLMFFGREQGGNIFNVHLWSNDGVTSTKIYTITTITQNVINSYIFDLNGTKGLFFTNDGTTGYEPWITDGTTAGTMLLKDINPGGNSVFSNGTTTCLVHNGKAYFAADNGTGIEPWVSDGTAAGTFMLKDISPSGSSSAGGFTVFNGEVYFGAAVNNLMNLWKTDGTAVGTTSITNPPTLSQYAFNDFFVDNNTIYFNGIEAGSTVNGLWKSDGTTAGTSMITNSLNPGNFIKLNSDILFYSNFLDGTCICYRKKLYKTNGTTTTLIKDSVVFQHPVQVGNKVVFGGEFTNSGSGYEPWVTDGTSTGTFSLGDVVPGTGNGFFNMFGSVSKSHNGKVYFGAEELWQTDGTVSGTSLLTNIKPTGVDGVIDFTSFGTDLYFAAFNPANNNRSELFKISGAASGLNENVLAGANVIVYPQPAKDKVTMDLKDLDNKTVHISIHDVTGKELIQGTHELKDGKVVADVSSVPQGVYVLQISNEEGLIATKKLIITR